MTNAALPTRNDASIESLAGGVTLMRASFADHAFERHSHDCFAIGATTHGIQRFRCHGRQYDSRPGDFVLFNPDQDHDGRPGTADGFRYTIWYLPTELIDGGSYFAKPHVSDNRMSDRFRALSSSLMNTRGEALRAESLVRAFAGTMMERHGGAIQTMAGGAMARVRDAIHAGFARDITVTELALVAGVSRAQLTRAFGAAYHMPPHVYLNAVRVSEAQQRIRRGMPLVQVALECGFADQSHLTRRFKGSVGVTPSSWRRMIGA